MQRPISATPTVNPPYLVTSSQKVAPFSLGKSTVKTHTNLRSALGSSGTSRGSKYSNRSTPAKLKLASQTIPLAATRGSAPTTDRTTKGHCESSFTTAKNCKATSAVCSETKSGEEVARQLLNSAFPSSREERMFLSLAAVFGIRDTVFVASHFGWNYHRALRAVLNQQRTIAPGEVRSIPKHDR